MGSYEKYSSYNASNYKHGLMGDSISCNTRNFYPIKYGDPYRSNSREKTRYIKTAKDNGYLINSKFHSQSHTLFYGDNDRRLLGTNYTDKRY